MYSGDYCQWQRTLFQDGAGCEELKGEREEVKNQEEAEFNTACEGREGIS